MVESKTIATIAVAVVLSLLGALLLNGKQGPSGNSGHDGQDGKDGSSFGALVSPDIASPFLGFGDVRAWAAGPTFALGGSTSTACNIQSPAATTTLVAATLRIDSIPYATAATTWGIYRSDTPDTKTTQLALRDVLPKGSIIATTSLTALVDGVVTPNSWISFILSTTTTVGPSFTPTGKCSVVFREI